MITEGISDTGLVLELFRTVTEKPFNLIQPNNFEHINVESDHCAFVCLPSDEPRVFQVVMMLLPTWSRVDDITTGWEEFVEHMFLHTDALRLWGKNKPDASIYDRVKVRSVSPLKELSTDADGFIYSEITIGQWAKANGVQATVDKLTAAGQTDKAAKLAARL